MTKRLLLTSMILTMPMTGIILTDQRQDQHYRVVVYRSGKGWGYNVLLNNRIIICQPYIPVIQGNYPFRDKKTALKTGKLVAKKLSSGKSPGLSQAEIIDLDAIP